MADQARTSTDGQQAPIDQPQDAVQMTAIDNGADKAVSSNPDNEQETPSVPAKDNVPAAAESSRAAATATDGDSSQQQSKEKDEDSAPPQPAQKDRTDSLSIGPSDAPPAASNPADGPVCNITLLLPTGARHPYKIDEKYLTKRNVEVPELTEEGKKDPFSISVYKLKELILREWREEWDGKPASPSSIRLIHFGKLLEDKELLKKYQFSAEAPNVVHMSVKPAEMLEEDEAAKGKSSGREGRNRDGGSGCCVIL